MVLDMSSVKLQCLQRKLTRSAFAKSTSRQSTFLFICLSAGCFRLADVSLNPTQIPQFCCSQALCCTPVKSNIPKLQCLNIFAFINVILATMITAFPAGVVKMKEISGPYPLAGCTEGTFPDPEEQRNTLGPEIFPSSRFPCFSLPDMNFIRV